MNAYVCKTYEKRSANYKECDCLEREEEVSRPRNEEHHRKQPKIHCALDDDEIDIESRDVVENYVAGESGRRRFSNRILPCPDLNHETNHKEKHSKIERAPALRSPKALMVRQHLFHASDNYTISVSRSVTK